MLQSLGAKKVARIKNTTVDQFADGKSLAEFPENSKFFLLELLKLKLVYLNVLDYLA